MLLNYAEGISNQRYLINNLILLKKIKENLQVLTVFMLLYWLCIVLLPHSFVNQWFLMHTVDMWTTLQQPWRLLKLPVEPILHLHSFWRSVEMNSVSLITDKTRHKNTFSPPTPPPKKKRAFFVQSHDFLWFKLSL